MFLVKNLISLLSIKTVLFIFADIAGIKSPKFKIGDSVCIKNGYKKHKGIITTVNYCHSHKNIIMEYDAKNHHPFQYKYCIDIFEENVSSYENNINYSPCLLQEKRI